MKAHIADAAARGATKTRKPFRWAHVTQEQIVLAVTALLFVLLSVFLRGFFSSGNLLSLLRSVSVLGILGIGMAVVVLARGLDLSQIAILTIGSGWVVQLMNGGMQDWQAVLVGFAAACAIGALNGLIVAFVELPALFATLASGMVVYGLGRAQLLGTSILYVTPGHDRFLAVGQGSLAGIPYPVLVFLLLGLLAQLFFSRTSPGRFLYGLGDNYEAARLSGIPVRPLTVFTYTASAGIAFIAGIVFTAQVAQVNTQVFASTLIFDVVLVIVLGGISLLGGRGSMLSVLAGVLLVGVLLNGMVILNFDNNIQNIVKSVVLLAAIIIDNYLHPRDEETARQGDI